MRDLRRAADAYVRACFAREATPRVSELARELGLPLDKLSAAFLQAVGIRPSAYLKAAQVRRAQQLLRTTAMPLNRIAYTAGFGTRTTFFRAFRRMTGITPAAYRHLK
jgi:transcriptional regulator GlxA family with amidase domain